MAALDVGKGPATVVSLKGSAEVMEAGSPTWGPLNLRDTLEAGDQVRTGAGARMELLLADQSRLRFAGNSEFRVIRMKAGSPSTPRDIDVHLLLGRAWANVKKTVADKENFSVSSDLAVAGVRGTVYRMDIEPDHSALVRVYDGTVHVTGGAKAGEAAKPLGPPTPVPGPRKVTLEEWTLIIRAMQQVKVGTDGVPEKPRDFTAGEDRDEWVDWNRARDREN